MKLLRRPAPLADQKSDNICPSLLTRVIRMYDNPHVHLSH
jgi:hypothetical protein